MGNSDIGPSKRARRHSQRAMFTAGLRASGLGAVFRRLPAWRGALVLSYHRIGDRSQSDLHRGLFSTSAEGLDRQLRLLTRHFDLVAPGQLDADLLAARGRHVIVTFDDGYRDLYELAHPVLQANNVRALMFLCTGFIDGQERAWWDDIGWMLRHAPLPELPPGPWSPRPLPLAGAEVESAIDVLTRAYWGLAPPQASEFLLALASATGAGIRPTSAADWITWDMARELKGAGHVIGAHTASHPLLSRLPRARQLEEIVRSLDRVDTELGERPRWLAYPVGTKDAFDATTIEVARQAGVEMAFSNYGGRVTRAGFTPLDVRRVPVESMRTFDLFSATVSLPQVLARPSRAPRAPAAPAAPAPA
jgi:peptidoglycan/xylan/chitin deacetylase (PgdA/CDA1 family)